MNKMKYAGWLCLSALVLTACGDEPKPNGGEEELQKFATEFSVAGLGGKTGTLTQADGKTVDVVFDATGKASVTVEATEAPVFKSMTVDGKSILLGRKSGGNISFEYGQDGVVSRVKDGKTMVAIVEELAMASVKEELLDDNFVQENDLYFSEMTTWKPVGESIAAPFTGSFDGNGHQIYELKLTEGSAMFTGLFGVADGAKFSNVSIASGIVGGASHVGALVGYVTGDKAELNNCSSAASVEGTQDAVGGLVGGMDGGKVISCTNSGEVVGKGEVGGIMGVCEATVASVEQCVNTGTVSAVMGTVGGIAGESEAAMSYCENKGKVNGMSIVGGIAGEYGGSDKAVMESCTSVGVVTASSRDLGGFAGVLSGGTVKMCTHEGTLVSAVEIEGNLLTNVGGIAGTVSEGATIYGCVNSNVAVFPSQSVTKMGGIAGLVEDGLIDHCTNSYDLSLLNDYLGGIAGQNMGEIVYSTNQATLYGNKAVGGVTGANEEGGSVRSSENKSPVKGMSDYVGGIAGLTKGEILACKNSGAADGKEHVGGITGSIIGNGARVIAGANHAMIHGNKLVGGVAGDVVEGALLQASFSVENLSGLDNVGGVCGRVESGSKVVSCYWTVYANVGLSNGLGEVYYFNDGSKKPEAAQYGWPKATDEHWGIGDGTSNNWWRNLGLETTKSYPVLFWE